MFYPVDSLKRGGRFYLCWVADSWPLRFATITHRQLWSQDIRKICDELIEVMTNESGRPTNRYSLRLSSQLMRGLVRLYQRKVTVFLSELCMINANVIRHANKKFNVHEILDLPHRGRPQPQILELPPTVISEVPDHEPRVEELIQNSGNVVSNIQDITLKEAVIPEFQLPPNDGFGEENPEQALQLLGDRTVEMMMPADASAAHSGVDLGLSLTDKSHDKSRLVPRDIQMERLSEHDVTLFRRSDGESLLPAADFEKEIPEIPDVPIPDMPVPQEKEQQEPAVEIPEVPIELPQEEPAQHTARVSEKIELEELEETEPRAKRRRIRRRLIIDKKIKISPNVLRARIENPNVELRCEDSSDDIIEIQVPYEVFMRRPCHAGFGARSNLADALTRLFMRNLGVVHRPASAERELEEGAMARSLRFQTRSMLERIEEVEEPKAAQERGQPQAEPVLETTMNQDNLPPQEVDICNMTDKEQDIADMLTQKIETLSQQAKKRASADIEGPSQKRQRSIGYVSFRESQQKRLEEEVAVPDIEVPEAEKQQEVPEFEIEMDKENVPVNEQTPKRGTKAERSVTAMLQEAGLADIPTHQPMEPAAAVASQKPSRKQRSEGSETPLGSLDRTKVSLGDSEQTTDSRRFIRDQWGTEGTMIKILTMIKERKHAVTVRNLTAKGPLLSGYRAIIAARCFTSILKLKQNGFIKVKKSPDTLEIEDVELGLKFY